MFGGGGTSALVVFRNFLISLVDEAGDFAANLHAGLGKETRRASSPRSIAAETLDFFRKTDFLCRELPEMSKP